MTITMQGPWTVSVKFKEAAFQQRFVIAGATSGNGTYAGLVTTPPVSVIGPHWSLTIQNNPGTGWVNSDDQIKFPTLSGGQYRFDIESNDQGVDQDFNDLILTCSTPQTATDFMIYGNVAYYSGMCFLNPCNQGSVIIDSVFGLKEALKYPVLRGLIEKFYPDRLWEIRPPIGPTPDPPPFRPMSIPFRGQTMLPPKQAQVVKTSVIMAKTTAATAKTTAKIQPIAEATRTVVPMQVFDIAKAAPVAALDFDRLAVASIIDRIRPYCETAPLKGVVVKLQEYDRTSAELIGGPYTGTGNREDLGVCATDRNGNYIFRFTRSIADIAHESVVDVAAGEDVTVQAFPDIIAQLVDSMAPTGISYESAPYWNVPFLKRVDICAPKVNLPMPACQGGNAIQAIGNIFIGVPQADGTRVGFNNSLGAEGKITAKNTLGPQTRCAAWAGTMDFFACFLRPANQPQVTQYTIRYRRKLPDMTWTGWAFFQQEYRHPLIASIGLPNYNGDLVGPWDRTVQVGGGPAVSAKVYDNIESNSAWVFSRRDRKAQISSPLYAPTPGPVQFRIEGYNATGAKLAEDTITIYIDNSAPDRVIDPNITMGTQTLGNCALFTLPAGQSNAPLTVRFKVDQQKGFLNSYALYAYKGATGNFPVLPPLYPQPVPPQPPSPYRGRSYEHGDDLVCTLLHGTPDDPNHDPLSGYVTVGITAASGSWLEPTQPFCAFSINLSCSTRVTNGYWNGNDYWATPVLIGIQK